MSLKNRSSNGNSFKHELDEPGIQPGYLQKLSTIIKDRIEDFFYRWGYLIGIHPWKFVTVTLLLTLTCSSGLIFLYEEKRPDKLILPSTSDYAVHTEWLRTRIPIPFRENYAGISADNVLTPEILKLLIDVHETVKSVSTPQGKTWSDVCFRVPITKFDIEEGDELLRRRRRNAFADDNRREFGEDPFADDFFDEINSEANSSAARRRWEAYHNMPESLYCDIIEGLEEACLEFNPAELWAYDKDKMYNLTQEEIIRVFNHEIISPVFGRKTIYKIELGGEVERNENGEIVKATSVLMRWVVKIDLNQEIITDSQGMIGDQTGLDWEREWIKAMKKFSKTMPKGVKLYFANASCWGDIMQETVIEEGLILMCGFAIMLFYVGIMLGKLNIVEQRPFLTMAGVGSIAFALLITGGVCGFLGIPLMILSRVLPFLSLGLGIDDMFVYIQCWNNLYPSSFDNQKNRKPLPVRIGLTLKHAGASITVTSLTDVVAFTAGSMTTIPALGNFCVMASMTISVLYVLQCTFFVACFAIDQKRLEERRNAYIYCIKYDEAEFRPRSSSNKSFTQLVFDKVISKYLLKPMAKVIVIFVTVCLLGAGIYGNTLLQQKSDALWFLPEDSYLVQYFEFHRHNYPEFGFPGVVVAHEVNFTESLNTYGTFAEELQKTPFLLNLMEFYTPFKAFVKEAYNIDLNSESLEPGQFNKLLGRFLFSPYGAMYKYFFRLDENFTCGKPVSHIRTVSVPFWFKHFPDGAREHVPAMNRIKGLVRNASRDIAFNKDSEDPPTLFFWAQISIAWEVDEIIKGEMYRNLGIAMVCVMLATLVLLMDLKMCLMCGISVVFTVLDVSGFMHYWGLTIDSVACTILVLAIGLCVDYAAHICLAFMDSKGNRDDRAKKALTSIGPAVFMGGFSTFLGVILLVNAKTVAARSFFKIFTLVVAFGLFHGLIFLPVLLSIVGPAHSRVSLNIAGRNRKSVEMRPLSNGTTGSHDISTIAVVPKSSIKADDPLL